MTLIGERTPLAYLGNSNIYDETYFKNNIV